VIPVKEDAELFGIAVLRGQHQGFVALFHRVSEVKTGNGEEGYREFEGKGLSSNRISATSVFNNTSARFSPKMRSL
jgi:hypothetical protein